MASFRINRPISMPLNTMTATDSQIAAMIAMEPRWRRCASQPAPRRRAIRD
jgi:hypothetical protein